MTVSSEVAGLRGGLRVLASGAPAGALAGTTFVVKDLIDVAGSRTGAGNPRWLAEQGPAREHAPVVARLLGAGATCVGKAHTDEFAFSLSGRNAHYGTPANAAAPGATCGGSSSGSASAVAAGLATFALGTDTGGSVRVPASACGLVGVRPTHGRVPVDGVLPLAPTFDTVGWLAADLPTAVAVGNTLLDTTVGGPVSTTPPARLLVLTDALASVPPDVAETTRRCAQRWAEALGADLVDVQLPAGPPVVAEVFRELQAAEAWRLRGAWLTANSEAVSPDVMARFRAGSEIDDEALAAASARRDDVRQALLSAWDADQDWLVLPSASGPAPDAAPPPGHDEQPRRTADLRLTSLAGVLGAPAVSVPAGSVGSRPVGLSLVAAPGDDERLLSVLAGVTTSSTTTPTTT